MPSIHLTLSPELLSEALAKSRAENRSLNEYLVEAIKAYNHVQGRKLLARRMRKASQLVSRSSMEVLHEMETLDDPDHLV